MYNSAIIEQMRAVARSGGDVPAIVSVIMKHPEEPRKTIFLVIVYFMEAFHLSLPEVHPLAGAACLGNAAYTDAEINSLLLPLIRERLEGK
jgi:hypothetical protein